MVLLIRASPFGAAFGPAVHLPGRSSSWASTSLPAGGGASRALPPEQPPASSHRSLGRGRRYKERARAFSPGTRCHLSSLGLAQLCWPGAWHSRSALPSRAPLAPRAASSAERFELLGTSLPAGDRRLWNKQSCFCGCRVKTSNNAVFFCSWLD